MSAIFRDLYGHQAHADAAMITAIRRDPTASQDDELRKLLHHSLVAHRYWIHVCQGLAFSAETEDVVPATLDEVVQAFRAVHELEFKWLDQLQTEDLERVVESLYFPDRRITLAEALTQVCLHSQGHRAQCALRLRKLGGEPPSTDYIFWVRDRPQPVWS